MGLAVSLPMVMLPTMAAADMVGDKPPVGKPAPDFTLPDLDGKKIELSQYRKKIVVLEWFADDCPYVKKHYNSQNMQELQKYAVGKGVKWLSICSSGVGNPGFHSSAEQKRPLKDWQANMSDFLVDYDGKVGRAYGSKNTPTMYAIGKDGTLLYEGAIDDKPDPFPDSVKGAHNYVRAALDEALAGKAVSEPVTKAYG